MARILIIDDEEPIRFSLRGILEDEGYEVLEAATAEEGLEVADAERPDLVFLDIWLPGMDGLTAQARLKGNHPDLPVVMISGHGTIETAVSAIQQGAYDFIEKPLSLEKVVIVAARALEAGSLRRENQVLRTVLPEQDELIGQSPVMLKFQELLARVAPTDVWVLLTGENGTGKELAARALHAGSRRADAPMIAVNCAAIPEELIESELFGHERGAFTDARESRPGKFEAAHGSTLFLDEIGNLPLGLQAKLLAALQNREVTRLGSNRKIPVDIRLIAATNHNLPEMVAQSLFREDLFYRINTIQIEIPPLRNRREDIALFVDYFLKKYTDLYSRPGLTLHPQALEKLANYDWPGNIRELQHTIEKAVILAEKNVIRASDLFIRPGKALSFSEVPNLEEVERQAILAAITQNEGNLTAAAEQLGVSRQTLYNKMKRFNL